MNFLLKSFLKGLLVLFPIVATGYAIYFVVSVLDRLLAAPLPLLGEVPGAGLVLAAVVVTGLGVVASNALGQRVLRWLEEALVRVPVVKIVYGSLKDLTGAFVGEQKRFSEPVMVELDPAHGTKALGFVTCKRFDDPQLEGHVAVYLPQSYNFAGNLVVVPRERTRPIDADGAQFLAFVVSGGVAEMGGARTVFDRSVAAR